MRMLKRLVECGGEPVRLRGTLLQTGEGSSEPQCARRATNGASCSHTRFRARALMLLLTAAHAALLCSEPVHYALSPLVAPTWAQRLLNPKAGAAPDTPDAWYKRLGKVSWPLAFLTLSSSECLLREVLHQMART